MPNVDRRSFLLAAGGLTGCVAAGGAAASALDAQPATVQTGDQHRGVCSIASGNGRRCVDKAMEMIRAGADPVDAVVEGVTIIEDDPDDMSVGLGGLPNEEGVVQLDASVMHGPTHKAGAVACIEGIRNPARVALLVLKRTDHILLVGEGARRFALSYGFNTEELLTPRAREAWLKWRANRSLDDDWLNDEEMDFPAEPRLGAMRDIPFTYGTVHCAATNARDNISATTSTSGLSWKIPGRVGDSPIVGAGMYVDNDVGAAGATGRGEAVIANCGSFNIVEHMARGLTPTEACLAVAKRIADRTREKRLRDERGRPNFNVSLYALRKDGAYGAACLHPGGTFAVHDGTSSRVLRCVPLFEA
ncbi:MAG: N(4)-(beta-N-acetylglucosaminyl)-L-asparaginase [Phycisphaeraceae bacterium]|nr:N(4)-(beta-N-acetylglucosaminyl)-L-asparaginase [Phycisphaeraceae bacterium]MCW5753407.1 N(4)-(beta-N-acetylglucosaminyl)-L-asparaginase [Phycisphaeraceae bacterium]